MKNPKESKEKVVIKPRPPKGKEESAPVNPIGPEEMPEPLADQPAPPTPPTPPAQEVGPAEKP